MRAKKVAEALLALGIKPGDRIGTLAWNGYRHFELYYGISGMGAVCHTINPRLFPEQIAYIVNHAEDRSCSSTSTSCRWSRSCCRSSRRCATSWP